MLLPCSGQAARRVEMQEQGRSHHGAMWGASSAFEKPPPSPGRRSTWTHPQASAPLEMHVRMCVWVCGREGVGSRVWECARRRLALSSTTQYGGQRRLQPTSTPPVSPIISRRSWAVFPPSDAERSKLAPDPRRSSHTHTRTAGHTEALRGGPIWASGQCDQHEDRTDAKAGSDGTAPGWGNTERGLQLEKQDARTTAAAAGTVIFWSRPCGQETGQRMKPAWPLP